MSVLDPILRFNQAMNRRVWGGIDHRHLYRKRLDRLLRDAHSAVHVGAGWIDPAILTSADLSKLRIYAVDPSIESLRRSPNPRRMVAWGHEIPLPDDSTEVVFSEYVMEHVEQPRETVREAHRVLRPGGHLIWTAPNLWSYSGLVTHLTPIWFHRWVNKLLEPLQRRRAEADVFPTFFRINSIPRIRRILSEAGFELEELVTTSHAPHYTAILPGVHQLAMGLHLLLDRFEILRHFRVVQIVVARKPE
jgi:ubiquinone/menaquinone biosynthesis C-methylase UbiE